MDKPRKRSQSACYGDDNLNYTNILYEPIYNALGVQVEIACLFGAKYTLTAIDKTSGVEIGNSSVDVGTVRPVMALRASELKDLGLRPQDLEEGIATLNGREWTIKTTILRPSPNGENDGEIYAVLMDATDV